MHLRFLSVVLLVLALAACGNGKQPGLTAAPPAKAKNVILFIGDGMGLAQVSAAAMARHGQAVDAQGNPARLSFENFPVTGHLATHSANRLVTDSAAAGTALSTGHKTRNGSLGVDPDEAPLGNITELARAQGKATLVLSSVGLNHATPAAFYAKVAKRGDYDIILDNFFELKTVDVLIGGGLYGKRWEGAPLEKASTEAGYSLFTMNNLDAFKTATFASDQKIIAYFDSNNNKMLDFPAVRKEKPTQEPRLLDITLRALDRAVLDPDGFFMMVEGGSIDWACHDNNAQNAIDDTLEFDQAVEATLAYLAQKGILDQTLIIVTADHETGAMAIVGSEEEGGVLEAGKHPSIAFSSKGHSAIPVGVWATGPGATAFAGKNDNTAVFRIMAAQFSR